MKWKEVKFPHDKDHQQQVLEPEKDHHNKERNGCSEVRMVVRSIHFQYMVHVLLLLHLLLQVYEEQDTTQIELTYLNVVQQWYLTQ